MFKDSQGSTPQITPSFLPMTNKYIQKQQQLQKNTELVDDFAKYMSPALFDFNPFESIDLFCAQQKQHQRLQGGEFLLDSIIS